MKVKFFHMSESGVREISWDMTNVDIDAGILLVKYLDSETIAIVPRCEVYGIQVK